MVFDAYSTEEEALKSFGCTVELHSLKESPRAVATATDGPNVRVRQVEDVTILDVGGKLRGEPSTVLSTQTTELLNAHTGIKKLLFNLSGVTSMDSAGLGCLLYAHRSARACGTAVKFIMSQAAKEMLKIARLF